MWAVGKLPPLRRVIPPGWAPPTDERHVYILALDPGVASGWWALRCALGPLAASGFRGVALGGPTVFAATGGEFTGPEPYQAELFLALARGLWAEGVWDAGPESDLFIVAIEDFILRIFSQDRDLLAPVRVTSCVEALSWRGLPPPVVRFSSSDTMSVVTDDRLRSLNLYRPGPDHVRDAARVAVLAARKLLEPAWRRSVLSRMAWLEEAA